MNNILKIRASSFSASAFYARDPLWLAKLGHHIMPSEMQVSQQFIVHSTLTFSMIKERGHRTPKRTNLVKGTDSLISKHLLGDGSCRALSQLDFDLKMKKKEIKFIRNLDLRPTTQT
jgi:hypothetical protein